MITLDNAVTSNSAGADKQEMKAGQFAEYNSQLDYPEIKGMRIAKFLGRASAKGEKAESKYCYVPTRHISADSVADNIEQLMPHIISWLQGVEDEDIKKELKQGALSYFTEKLDMAYVISLLNAKATSGRLSGEQVEKWFASDVKPVVIEAFIGKLGYDASALEVGQTLKLEGIAKAYCNKFKSLASPKVVIPDDEKEALLKVISLISESEVSLKIKTRLENTVKETETLEFL
ncbi:MAG: hypothetical protein CMK07_13575 [Ponticaulis sp.]|nr:hypothetical protein [Ponticaulis sp.]|tara:strand:- start:6444 stop:7142 length:699 start_codon:yes stop_codon:yes gene_type:complete